MITFLTNEVSKNMKDNQSKNGDIVNSNGNKYSPGTIVRDAKGKLWKLSDDGKWVDCSHDTSTTGNYRACTYGNTRYVSGLLIDQVGDERYVIMVIGRIFKILNIVTIILFLSISQNILAASNNNTAGNNDKEKITKKVTTKDKKTKVRTKRLYHPKTRVIAKYKNKEGKDGVCIQPLSFSSGEFARTFQLALKAQESSAGVESNSSASINQVVVAELLRTAFFQLCNEKQIGNMGDREYAEATERLMLAVTLFTIGDIISASDSAFSSTSGFTSASASTLASDFASALISALASAVVSESKSGEPSSSGLDIVKIFAENKDFISAFTSSFTSILTPSLLSSFAPSSGMAKSLTNILEKQYSTSNTCIYESEEYSLGTMRPDMGVCKENKYGGYSFQPIEDE